MLRRAHIYFAENRPAIVAPVHYNAAGFIMSIRAVDVICERLEHLCVSSTAVASAASSLAERTR
jgi:type IV secretory pathway VirB3-like protein